MPVSLPVIVGFGGVSPAGRSSSHYAYKRLIFDLLSDSQAKDTLQNLAVMMNILSWDGKNWFDGDTQQVELNQFLSDNKQKILDSTLIRKLEDNLFDPDSFNFHPKAKIHASHHHDGEKDDTLNFSVATKKLPKRIPENWALEKIDNKHTRVTVLGGLDIHFKDSFSSPVNTAGQLPSGFEPAKLYPSRNHPRGLQMTIYGASDALNSIGIDWETIQTKVAPDQIAVYAGSSMNQLDYNGYGGLLQARLLGKKITSKQLPLGFGEMPADFINAYMLGNVGTTGSNLGACASFHYNLRQGVRDIQNGSHRVVIVGGSEAPLTPEIIEAFANMGALADDAKLLELDADLNFEGPDHRRACRPFGNNVGFTLGESAQFVVLFDDTLAMELGATVYGAVNDVFINADGHKKSIASPGVGNYLTVAKATAATRAVLGEDSLRHKTFVQAHGTGTPQNRVTESDIFTQIASHFKIENWPVTAVKSYLGHSIACSGADQLITSLGFWQHGIIPGILTTGTIADDVSTQGLDFLLAHKELGVDAIDAVILNSKGFGGNNATASLLSPAVTRRMLERKHGQQAMHNYEAANEKVMERAGAYQTQLSHEQLTPTYKFDHDVKGGNHLSFDSSSLKLKGYETAINLDLPNPYGDMCD